MENNTFNFGDNNFNNNFNYNTLSGLGESDYENEDLFKDNSYSNDENLNNNVDESNNTTSDFNGGFSFEPSSATLNNFNGEEKSTSVDNYNKIDDSFWFNIGNQDVNSPNDNVYNINPVEDLETKSVSTSEEINDNNLSNVSDNYSENFEDNTNTNDLNNTSLEKSSLPAIDEQSQGIDEDISQDSFSSNNYVEPTSESTEVSDNVESSNNDIEVSNPENDSLEQESEPVENELPSDEDVNDNKDDANETNQPDELTDISLSDTPIEELQDLTQYEEDDIEETNIGSLFDKVSVNVKEASDIFRKNTEMKSKIDKRFKELKELQNDIETKRQNQVNEINSYKDEVFKKLTEKKDEIEKRLNMLKEMQSDLENDKKEFEEYRKNETSKIEEIKEEVQMSYDERREELNHVEELLRKQKDELDQERNQLSLDKIQYEADKNELANNLLKFNELVDTFTNGVNDVKSDE